MNFYKRFMGDYGRDTAHLSLAEHGAYTLLLDHYYSTEAPLPADYMALYRICRAFDKKEQEAVRCVADQFFQLGQDGLRHNGRADVQIPKDRALIDTARENGKKGGRPKKAKPNGTGQEPKENPAGFYSETDVEPSTKTHHSHSQIAASVPNGTEAAHSAHAAADATGTPHGQMAAALRRRGVDVTSQNPLLLAWVAAGVTLQQALEATEIAQSRKPGERIPARYLDAIVQGEILNPKPTSGRSTTRHADFDDINYAAGREELSDGSYRL